MEPGLPGVLSFLSSLTTPELAQARRSSFSGTVNSALARCLCQDLYICVSARVCDGDLPFCGAFSPTSCQDTIPVGYLVVLGLLVLVLGVVP